jgi:hypothetical protein
MKKVFVALVMVIVCALIYDYTHNMCEESWVPVRCKPFIGR